MTYHAPPDYQGFTQLVGRENMASVVRRYAPSSTRLEMMPPGWRPEND